MDNVRALLVWVVVILTLSFIESLPVEDDDTLDDDYSAVLADDERMKFNVNFTCNNPTSANCTTTTTTELPIPTKPTRTPRPTKTTRTPRPTKSTTTRPIKSTTTRTTRPPRPIKSTTTRTTRPPRPTKSTTTRTTRPPRPTKSTTTRTTRPPRPTKSTTIRTTRPPRPTKSTTTRTTKPPRPTKSTTTRTTKPPRPTKSTTTRTTRPPRPTKSTTTRTTRPPRSTKSTTTGTTRVPSTTNHPFVMHYSANSTFIPPGTINTVISVFSPTNITSINVEIVCLRPNSPEKYSLGGVLKPVDFPTNDIIFNDLLVTTIIDGSSKSNNGLSAINSRDYVGVGIDVPNGVLDFLVHVTVPANAYISLVSVFACVRVPGYAPSFFSSEFYQ